MKKSILRRLGKDGQGTTAVELALILVMLSIALISVMGAFADSNSVLWQRAIDKFNTPSA